MKNFFITIIVSSFIISSCGEKFNELKQVAEVIEKAPEIARNIEKGSERAEQRLAERRSKGDTLAIHFNELIKYLPENIDGYTAEKPEGSTMNTGEFSYSTATRSYYRENSEGYNDYVRITLFDYNQGYAYFAFLSMWANMGMSFESTDGWQKTFNTGIEDVFGLEEYKHDSKRTSLAYAVGYRFYLTIEVDNVENTDFARNIAKKIDLKKLAAM